MCAGSWGDGRGTEFNDDEVLLEKWGGKTAFMRWTNENMIVSAQIESKPGWDNLDDILSVPGLTSIAGGPNAVPCRQGMQDRSEAPEGPRLSLL